MWLSWQLDSWRYHPDPVRDSHTYTHSITCMSCLYRAAVLLFLWLIAMAAGVVFKRFMMGAKGWEQIPLLDWYKAFGNLEAVS